MAKTKIKSKKIRKQTPAKKTQENKYFLGALLTIGGLFVIGIAAVILFGSGGSGNSATGPVSGHDAQIVSDMESKFGAKWRGLGYTDWAYTPDPMFYVDLTQWSNLNVDQRKERMNQVGKDLGKVIEVHGRDPKQLYIMFHDAGSRNQMIGTYTGAGGAQIQQ